MMRIEEITKIDKKHIALMDTSSISFMQGLQNKEDQGDGSCGLSSQEYRLKQST